MPQGKKSFMLNLNEEPLSTEPVLPPPLPQDTKKTVTNTTVGKSIGWLILFLIVFFGVAILYAIFAGVRIGMTDYELAAENPDLFMERIESKIEKEMGAPGVLFLVGAVQFLLLTPLVIRAANYKDRSWRDSLAIKPVPLKTLGFWLLVYCGYFAAQTVLNLFIKPDVGDVFEQVVGSKHFGVFLFIAGMAPVIEELVFRGYMFNAWRNTRAGAAGTILITALLFSLLHAGQYPAVVLGYLFVFGILLGAAREKTNSVFTPMMMHAVNNIIAAVAMVYLGIR